MHRASCRPRMPPLATQQTGMRMRSATACARQSAARPPRRCVPPSHRKRTKTQVRLAANCTRFTAEVGSLPKADVQTDPLPPSHTGAGFHRVGGGGPGPTILSVDRTSCGHRADKCPPACQWQSHPTQSHPALYTRRYLPDNSPRSVMSPSVPAPGGPTAEQALAAFRIVATLRRCDRRRAPGRIAAARAWMGRQSCKGTAHE